MNRDRSSILSTIWLYMTKDLKKSKKYNSPYLQRIVISLLAIIIDTLNSDASQDHDKIHLSDIRSLRKPII